MEILKEKIMQIASDCPSGVTRKNVLDELEKKEGERRSKISPALQRLVEQGFLKKQYIYSPTKKAGL